ncbi:hypothetical protein DL766_007796 [Monosporascus sp. MC13-8B]|uniref:Uncharacterized protein n=1 Tax=Monosporascus cannonballus TaxID=155416 RepID=A0ABY0HCG4_9PEZI|nr:hypothetical protein DL763_008919 [Monosporascus cannonballus]RYO88206.1 hypothetical protein DL762_003811 [Monosporascus cannonballus]RYP22042.1 hypothetical protein DL766_007796 [Monosporascus sp. MC13-8B]
MWDRFLGGQKNGGAPTPSRAKLEAWQNAHSSSASGRRKSAAMESGIRGGNGQYQYAVVGGPSPKEPPKESPSNTLAPPVQTPPESRNAHHNSEYGRPTSSIYSEPSPVAATYAAQQLRSDILRNDPNEVSPPSSSDVSNPREGIGSVSPIDDMPDMSQLGTSTGRPDPPKPEPRSNIPTLRRERRKNSDAAAHALRQQTSSNSLKKPRPYGNDVRWDPNTGEPTTSEKGRRSQIDPREFTQVLGTRNTTRNALVSPRHVKQAQQDQSAIGDRVRRIRGSSPEPAPAPRPEWRGASGRTPIIPPLNVPAPASLQVAPLKIPPRDDKRRGPPSRGTDATTPASPPESRSVSSPLHRNRGTGDRNGSGAASSTLRTDKVSAGEQLPESPAASKTTPGPSDQPYPSHSLSNTNTLQTVKDTTPSQPSQSAAQPQLSLPVLQVPSNEKATKRKTIGGAAAGPKPQPLSRPDNQPKLAVTSDAQDNWVQPPSRFSITTYATSNQPESRRVSIDEEASPGQLTPTLRPSSAASGASGTSGASGSSVMERGRPIVAGYERSPRLRSAEPVKISLNSTYLSPSEMRSTSGTVTSPTTAAERHAMLKVRPATSSDAKLRPATSSSTGSTEKELPPAPPEAESVTAGDRVAQLNARLEALGNRRININTAIRQMTELMPADRVLASDAVARKREQEKRKVEALRRELADVERESYEIGLKLHRAYKRLDRGADYEPTTLWVRRVTG